MNQMHHDPQIKSNAPGTERPRPNTRTKVSGFGWVGLEFIRWWSVIVDSDRLQSVEVADSDRLDQTQSEKEVGWRSYNRTKA